MSRRAGCVCAGTLIAFKKLTKDIAAQQCGLAQSEQAVELLPVELAGRLQLREQEVRLRLSLSILTLAGRQSAESNKALGSSACANCCRRHNARRDPCLDQQAS
jgi:hypothetical protein